MKKIIAITLCLLSLAMLFSCGSSSPKGANEAESYMIERFDALKAGTKQSLMSFIDEEDRAEAEATLAMFDFGAMFKNFDYEIVSSEINGDEATVYAKVTNIDFSQVLEKFQADVMEYALANMDKIQSMTEEETMKLSADILKDVILSGEFDKVSKDIAIELEKVDGKWKVEDSDALMSFVLPGLDM
jgi:superfamily I DNA and/or RNA helicase